MPNGKTWRDRGKVAWTFPFDISLWYTLVYIIGRFGDYAQVLSLPWLPPASPKHLAFSASLQVPPVSMVSCACIALFFVELAGLPSEIEKTGLIYMAGNPIIPAKYPIVFYQVAHLSKYRIIRNYSVRFATQQNGCTK